MVFELPIPEIQVFNYITRLRDSVSESGCCCRVQKLYTNDANFICQSFRYDKEYQLFQWIF